jgi:hypothetical protein
MKGFTRAELETYSLGIEASEKLFDRCFDLLNRDKTHSMSDKVTEDYNHTVGCLCSNQDLTYGELVATLVLVRKEIKELREDLAARNAEV